jgi:hypothetical protein
MNKEKLITSCFAGIWIPAIIWESKLLSANEKFLFYEIDSLDTGEGCEQEDKYFSRFLRVNKSKIPFMLDNLKEYGFIHEKNMDGKRLLFSNFRTGDVNIDEFIKGISNE